METKLKFKNLSEMLSSESYNTYETETLLNPQYHMINTDKDVDQMIECNEAGMFGCTHGEFMECWMDYLESLNVWESKYNTAKEKPDYDITKSVYNKIYREILVCEQRHIENFTYNNII